MSINITYWKEIILSLLPNWRDMYKIQPHIKLEKVDPTVLVTGNPDRVKIIAKHFKDAELQSSYRGLVSYKGFSPNKDIPVTILTTGMGGPSTAIVLEEAYRAGGRNFIRIGSCGSLLPEDPLGTLFLPYAAIRDEGTSKHLLPLEYPAVANPNLFHLLRHQAEKMNIDLNPGIVWTSDVYYQNDPNYFRKWSDHFANCVEMESSILFSFQGLKKDFKAATILTSDGNLVKGDDKYQGDIEEKYQIFNQAVTDSITVVQSTIDNYPNSFA